MKRGSVEQAHAMGLVRPAGRSWEGGGASAPLPDPHASPRLRSVRGGVPRMTPPHVCACPAAAGGAGGACLVASISFFSSGEW